MAKAWLGDIALRSVLSGVAIPRRRLLRPPEKEYSEDEVKFRIPPDLLLPVE